MPCALRPTAFSPSPNQTREVRAGIEVAVSKAEMERRLCEADCWFAHTLRCVADGVVVTDPPTTVRFINPAAEAVAWLPGGGCPVCGE